MTMEGPLDEEHSDDFSDGEKGRGLVIKQLLSWLTLMLLLGVSIGFVNVLFHKSTYEIWHWWGEEIVAEQETVIMKYALRVAGVLFSSIFTGFLTTYVVPECCGGGMLAVKVCLATDTSIPLKVGFFRFILTATYIGFGNTLGVEAPTLHICAAISCFLFELARIVMGDEMFPELHQNTVVMIGCTCGIACAFDTPFGGIMFVTEEFLRGSSGSRTFMLLLCICVTVGVVVSRQILGNKTFFDVSLDYGGNISWWMAYSIPAGIMGALASVLFVRVTLKVRTFYNMVFSEEYDIDPPFTIRIAQMLFDSQWRPFWAGVATSIFGVFCWEVTGLEGIFFTGTQDLKIFMSKDISVTHSVIFFLCKLMPVCVAVASDASGGVFYPSLVLGGSLGAMINQMCKYTIEEGGNLELTQEIIETKRYHLITIFGMMAMFSSVVRCPISAVIIVYEMTNVGKTRADLIFPSLAASLVGYMISTELQEKGIYEAMLEQTGLDLEAEDVEDDMSDGRPSAKGSFFQQSAAGHSVIRGGSQMSVRPSGGDGRGSVRRSSSRKSGHNRMVAAILTRNVEERQDDPSRSPSMNFEKPRKSHDSSHSGESNEKT